MNPYTVVPPRISQGLKDWQSLLPEPLSGDQPLRTARLMLAAAVLSDMPEASLDVRADFLRETALIRRVEWQQRLQFLSLLPRERPCERVLLALFMLTELTAAAAQRETHPRARAAMDFLLPEACDMLYRTANLLSLEYGVSADEKLGGMAELMPGRPCIAAHRHPYDEVQPPIERAQASPQTLLSLFLLSCAASYAARLSAGALGESREHARALYAELSLILTEHATQYSSLLGHAGDPCEALTLRAYALCYALDGLRAQEEDAALRLELEQSEKDKSELLMIVDLERNDLNRVCRPGSVKVTELFTVEAYATVFHLVSNIQGQLAEGMDVTDLLKAAFPGGSITGAPKYRAMEIIDELEHGKRGLYTGSIGYLTLDGACDLNIVIRTALHRDGRYHLGVGGGITAESDLEFEYEETLQKARAVLEALA